MSVWARGFTRGIRRWRLDADAVAACLLLLLPLAVATRMQAQSEVPMPQTWSGRMQVPEGVNPGLTADRFELTIRSQTTGREIETLNEALRRGGQQAVREAMFRMQPRAWIRIGALAATEVVVIRVADLPDGRRRVRVFSDQPLRLYDKNDPPGSDAHPFGYMELYADGSGNGTGSLLAAASLAIDDEGLRLESAGTPVVPLFEVTTDRPPARVAP